MSGGETTQSRIVAMGYGLLLAFLFALPMSRALTNACLALMLIQLGWLLAKGFAKWDRYIAAWIGFGAVASLSALANYPYLNFSKALLDTARCLVVALSFYYFPYRDVNIMNRLPLAIVVGVTLASLWGLLRMIYSPAEVLRLDLPGGGAVSQSTILIGIALVTTPFLGAANWRLGPARLSATRVAGLLFGVCVFLSYALGISGARGSILGTLAAAAVIVAVQGRTWLSRHWIMGVAAVVVAMTLVAMGPKQWLTNNQIVDKIGGELQTGKLDYNDKLRLMSQYYGWYLYTHSGNLMLGVGPRNFSQARPGDIPQEIKRELPNFEVPPHAHNFVVTKLAEEGILGTIALAWLLGWIFIRLWRDRRDAILMEGWAWPLAVATWIVPVVSCSFNAPWFQEQALMSAAVFSVYLKRRAMLLTTRA